MAELTQNVSDLYNKFYDGTRLTDEEKTFTSGIDPNVIEFSGNVSPNSLTGSTNRTIATYLGYNTGTSGVAAGDRRDSGTSNGSENDGPYEKMYTTKKDIFKQAKKELKLMEDLLSTNNVQIGNGQISDQKNQIRNSLPAVRAAYNTARENYFNLRKELVRAYHPDTATTDGIENEVESFRARRITVEQFGTIFNNYVEKYKNNLKALNAKLNDFLDNDDTWNDDNWTDTKQNERTAIAKNLRISETVVLYLILEFQQITRELVEEISDYNAPGPSETYELSSEEVDELEEDTKYKIAKNKQNLENKRRGKFYMISILTAINFILLFLTIFLIFNV